MLFKRKNTKSPEETAAERAARLEATQKNLRIQLLKLETLKKNYVQKAAEAQSKGLNSQVDVAKNMLRKTMKTEKQISGMLMSIELGLQAKELVSITQSFVQCMNDISADIITDADATEFKKSKDILMKAAYKQKKQEEMLDQMLDSGNYSLLGTTDAETESEFDSEIDSLINSASSTTRFGNADTFRMKS